MEVYETQMHGLRALVMDGMADHHRLEGWGVHLAGSAYRRLQAVMGDDIRHLIGDTGPYPPEGPHFAYDAAPYLFLGRGGRGPLYVAWDTSLLIDYFQFGSTLWQNNDIPESIAEDYAAQLEGLQLLIALWVVRDIRFLLLPEMLDDAKKRLTQERRSNRIRALGEFAAALQLVGSGPGGIEGPTRDGLLVLPDSELQRAVNKVPAGFDRVLVTTAARSGCHVYLTRDKDVRKAGGALRAFGLLIASPLDLLEMLVAAGAFHCLLAPRFAYWPLPDQQRIAHLLRALPPAISDQLRSGAAE